MSTEVFSFNTRNLPTGDFVLAERPMPAGTIRLEIRIARCTTATPTIWPDASTKLSIALEVSYDGGATWVGGGGAAGMCGGVELNPKTGQERDYGGFIAGYSATPDRVRGVLTVENGPLRTSGSILVN